MGARAPDHDMTEQLTREKLLEVGMFPVLTGRYAMTEVVSVPFDFVAPHEQQADRNHGQTLHRLAVRGGLSACELAAVLEDREWHPMTNHEAWAAIFRAHAEFVRKPHLWSRSCTRSPARGCR